MPPTPTGVLLLNLGGPDSLAAVEPFLVNLFSDREIIQLPFGRLVQPVFARALSKARGPSVRKNYERIGGRSPQLPLTLAQAAALESRLNRGGGAFRARVGMRYSQPTIASALDALAEEGVSRIVALPLYPQYSLATTGSSFNALAQALDASASRPRPEVTRIESYPDDPAYLDAMTDTVRHALASFPDDRRDHAVLLFSAHGLPRSFVKRGDPYVGQVAATVAGILSRLDVPNRHVLGYQSRTGPVKWIEPGIEEVIASLGRDGVKELLIAPVSFVSDHIETLYEVDLLFAAEARAAGISTVVRSPALNSHPLFIEALAGLVERHLDGRS
ncbi:MAG: ferrochelatase [Vicinamibacterales bacterium]